MAELDGDQIPRQAASAEARGGALAAQQLRDLRAVRDDLERRVHDLRLTRQVTMQSLPSIRLVQENDKALVGKINSTLVNTVPLWRQQLAQALTIHRSREAAAAVAAASDLTNDLLRTNAENLRRANAETRHQIERGVFDIAAVSAANQTLIDTIEDSFAHRRRGPCSPGQGGLGTGCAGTATARVPGGCERTRAGRQAYAMKVPVEPCPESGVPRTVDHGRKKHD